MRRFVVFARCNHGCGEEVILEFEDTDTDAHCECECADACNTLIGNSFDTGWNELKTIKPKKKEES